MACHSRPSRAKDIVMKKHLVGLLAVLSLFAVLAPMGASAQGNNGQALQTETTVVNVYAISVWNDTGVTLTPGMSVTISATGTVQRGSGPSDPNGGGFLCGVCTSTTLPVYSLIGRIGTGDAFFVGTGPITVSGEGTLYLAFNDGLYADNSGYFVASISSECLPGNDVADAADKNNRHCSDPGRN
jgi:hypothetical protein